MPAPQQQTPGYPESVRRLLDALAKLPGIGRRSAERLAFHILRSPKDEAVQLADAIRDVKLRVRHCERCFSFADGDLCTVCADPRRDHATILIVEQPRDLLAIEQTGMYRGVYHVLLGRLAPLEGIGPDDITIAPLIERLDAARSAGTEPIREVILGLNPTLEGDGTGLYIADQAERRGIRVSRLARGLPSGSQLEYANKAVLADALAGRQPLGG